MWCVITLQLELIMQTWDNTGQNNAAVEQVEQQNKHETKKINNKVFTRRKNYWEIDY